MKGFIIACPRKYEALCLNNIFKIRYEYNINLPIEIWQIGQEISDNYLKFYQNIPNLHFKYVENFTDTPEHWRGFQIKAFILKYTSLTEPILCDADITFHSNPLVLYDDVGYKNTGTYFFRDLEKWKFYELREPSPDKFQSLKFYNLRKQFIHSVVGINKSIYFPPEWNHIYVDSYPLIPVAEAYQESGVVVINKNINEDIVNNIYLLNYNHNITYQYVYGDKETFWIGCIMANKPYTINNTYGYMLNGKLTHNYNGAIFFSQK